jgi:hypothetical protein
MIMEKKDIQENIKKAQLEWEAAGKAGKEERYVDELYHLYNALKNIDTSNFEWIQRINCTREFAFKALKLDELAFLIGNNIERNSYKQEHGDEDLMRKIAPNKLLIQYRLEMLYDYKKYYYNTYKLFDLLETYNNQKESVFWVDYLLKFNPKLNWTKGFKSRNFRFFVSDSQLFRRTQVGHPDYMTMLGNLVTARKMTFNFVQSNKNCSKPKGHFNRWYEIYAARIIFVPL